jgi:hypothetical protein
VTGEPNATLTSVRNARAEAVVTAGLAAYNKEHIGRVDHQTLDILMRSDSGEIDQPA